MGNDLMTMAPDEKGAIITLAVVRLQNDLGPFIDEGIVTGATATSLEIHPNTPHEAWVALGRLLTSIEGLKRAELSALQWWRGDWLRHGEWAWGDKFSEAVEATGYAERTLQNCQWVADRFEPTRRRQDVSFGHHSAVASLPPQDADRLLQKAIDEGLDRQALREEKRRLKDRASGLDPDVEEARRAFERAITAMNKTDPDRWGRLIVDDLLDEIGKQYPAATSGIVKEVELWVAFAKNKT